MGGPRHECAIRNVEANYPYIDFMELCSGQVLRAFNLPRMFNPFQTNIPGPTLLTFKNHYQRSCTQTLGSEKGSVSGFVPSV